MSDIDRTTREDAEYRDDGSKVATESDPSGMTETEEVEREERKLPNDGLAPEYGEEDDSDVAAPSPPTGA